MVPLLVLSGQGVKPPTEEDYWATALAELDGGNRRVQQLSSAADSG